MAQPSTIRSARVRMQRIALMMGLLAALAAPPGAAAQGTLELTTPYPAISVQPGASANFDIQIKSSEARRVDVSVSGTPEGWTADLRGGGFTVDSVFVSKDQKPDLRLDVKVPEGAASGTTRLTVTATSGGLTARLPVDITVAAQAGGSVELTSDFPNLKGRSDQTFSFTLSLENNTPQQLSFTLSASGPEGWTVDARPASQSQAASFAVDAGGTSTVTVTVTPSADAPSDTYEIDVRAAGGSFTADRKLSVEITGNVALSLTTSDERLSTNATAGSGRELTLVVTNTGTSPAENVKMASSSVPSNWTVTFDTETIAELAPNASQNVVATITPASDAIAGDYSLTFRASTAESTKSIDMRVTVETSPLLLVVGLLFIALVIGGLFWVFQRYGRR